MKFYHGTTRENALNILNGGEKNKPVWNCSYDDYLYVWSAEAIKESEGLEEDEVNYYCLNRAFESAQIAAAASEVPQNELIVLVFEFPEADVYEDFSCDNMECARRVNSDLDGNDFTSSLVEVWSHPHNSRLDAFVISSLLENDFFIKELEQSLLDAAKLIKENEVYLDELFTFDYAKRVDIAEFSATV